MTKPNDCRYWTTLAILALAAGSAAATEGNEPAYADMEVVEVVEKALPAPVSNDEYFAVLAADLNASLGEELRENLAVSAMAGYQLLAAELELSNGTRVAADDTDRVDGSDTARGATKGT